MIDSLGSKIQIHRIGPLKIGKIDFSRKPLEQEPCGKDINVPATDAISRQAVLETIDNRIEQIMRDTDEINKSYSHLSFAEGVHDGYCRLKCDLRILPSVIPQPRSEVLDKIRDEIERKAHSGQWSDATMYGMLKAVAIIDKYKTESEEKK